jgi:hypothetical protein
VAEPEVAVIVAVPLPFEVTTPAAETVVTVVSEDAHVTVGLAIVDPPPSFTVAASVAVSASDANERLVGASVTELAT